MHNSIVVNLKKRCVRQVSDNTIYWITTHSSEKNNVTDVQTRVFNDAEELTHRLKTKK